MLVNKLGYKFHDIHRGDVVVFKRPPGEPDAKIEDLIKRVVALPGETVEGRGGKVYVNGAPAGRAVRGAALPRHRRLRHGDRAGRQCSG